MQTNTVKIRRKALIAMFDVLQRYSFYELCLFDLQPVIFMLQRTSRYYHHKKNYNSWEGAPDWKPTRIFRIGGH